MLEPTSPAYPALIVFACALGMALGVPTFLIYGFGVFIDPLATELDAGRGAVSLALTIALLGNLIAGPLIGVLSDRYGPRRMVLLSTAALSLMLATLSLVENLTQLYVAALAMVLLAAGTAPITYTKIISAWFDKRRGFALGIALTGVGIGGALVPVVSQALIGGFGWRAAYQYLGVIVFVICFPLMSLILRNRPPAARPLDGSEPAAGSDEAGYSVRQAVRRPAFWLLAGGFLLVAMGNTGGLVHLPPLLTDAGLTPERAALYAGGLGIGVTVGRVIGGYLIDLFHAPYVAICFLAGPIIAYSFFLTGLDPDWAILPVVLFGIGMGAEFDVIPFLVTRYFGLKNFGILYGIQISTFSIGSGIGPAMMGYGFDSYGSYGPALIVAMLVLALGALLISRLGAYEFK